MNKKIFKIMTLLTAFLLYVYVSIYSNVPSSITLIEGKEITYPFYQILNMDFSPESSIKAVGSKLSSSVVGKESVRVSLFGKIPLKKIDVNVISKSVVLADGEIIGMKLKTPGLTVVTFEEFTGRNYQKVRPYENLNIQRGDMITSIDGEEITDVDMFVDRIQKSQGRELILELQRNKEKLTERIKPEIDRNDGKYKLGIWVKDLTSGVGTVTFIEPSRYMFAALGHGINDIDEMNLLEIKGGTAYRAMVLSVVKGQKGAPGEIRGAMKENDIFGNIVKNTRNGVFGYLDNNVELSLNPIEVGLKDEVMEGEAEILATVSGNDPKRYKVMIEKVNRKDSTLGRNMVIRVTDEELIAKTGGIVQGMSGSPIIQNGKLIGAVTHVLINEPTRGYGIFVENMLNEMAG
ncbi:MAG: SpoIVB peptidase [Clostridia bacterium]|nr:SpoIVB peptidase [Clostridia bacterium]